MYKTSKKANKFLYNYLNTCETLVNVISFTHVKFLITVLLKVLRNANKCLINI